MIVHFCNSLTTQLGTLIAFNIHYAAVEMMDKLVSQMGTNNKKSWYF